VFFRADDGRIFRSRHDEYDAPPEVKTANAANMAEQIKRYRSAHSDQSGQ
jgi:hypothetical protein